MAIFGFVLMFIFLGVLENLYSTLDTQWNTKVETLVSRYLCFGKPLAAWVQETVELILAILALLLWMIVGWLIFGLLFQEPDLQDLGQFIYCRYSI